MKKGKICGSFKKGLYDWIGGRKKRIAIITYKKEEMIDRSQVRRTRIISSMSGLLRVRVCVYACVYMCMSCCLNKVKMHAFARGTCDRLTKIMTWNTLCNKCSQSYYKNWYFWDIFVKNLFKNEESRMLNAQ